MIQSPWTGFVCHRGHRVEHKPTNSTPSSTPIIEGQPVYGSVGCLLDVVLRFRVPYGPPESRSFSTQNLSEGKRFVSCRQPARFSRFSISRRQLSSAISSRRTTHNNLAKTLDEANMIREIGWIVIFDSSDPSSGRV